MQKKKVARGRQIAVVIARAVPAEVRAMPEGKLWLAVIGLALNEADTDNDQGRRARSFLLRPDFEIVCDLLGLNFDFVQELIRDHAAWMRRVAA